MRKWISFFLATQFIASAALAKGKIQNEDVKSLSDIEAAVLTTTGNLTSGNACITSPASTTGLATGLFIYDTTTSSNISSGVTIAGLPGTCSAGQIQMSANASGTATGDTLTFGGQPSQLINDTKIWVTGVSPNQQLSSAIATGALGGSGGTKNYLTTYTASTSGGTTNTGNGDFEQGTTTGWSLGTIGTLTNGLPTGTPTFGSGASGNLSISVTTSSPLQKNYSLLYASTAATTQGNMLASSAFYIDSEDQGKVMQVKFSYATTIGASNNNYSGTSSNSFAWAAYDVTNSAWLVSAGNFCMTGSTSPTPQCVGTFQTGSTTQQIRFVFYNANASAGATTLKLDDFSVGPQTAPIGAVATDFDTTRTFTPVNFGTIAGSHFFSRRVGDSLEVFGTFTAGTTAAAIASITLPVSIDTTKLPSDTNGTVVGYAHNADNTSRQIYDVSVTGKRAAVLFYDGSTSNSIYFAYIAGTTTNQLTKNNASDLYTGASLVTVHFTIPVSGWSSQVQMSNDTDTRVASAVVTATGNLSVTSGSPVIFPVVNLDTHAGYNASTGQYTIPVSGYWDVSLAGMNPSSSTLGKLFVNGSFKNILAYTVASSSMGGGSAVVKVNAGDVLTIVPDATSTWNVSAGSYAPILSIKRLTGPAVVAATESVNASYGLTSSFTPSANNPIKYDTKVYDSHNAYNTSTGLYTVPASGKYRISMVCETSSAACEGYAVKNGAVGLSFIAFATAGNFGAGSITVSALAGDTLAVYSATAATYNGSVTQGSFTGVYQNYISIERVGN